LRKETVVEQSRIESAREADLRSAEDCGYFCGYVDTTSELFERRLGRPLNRLEAETLNQVMATLPEDQLYDVLLRSSRDALAAWLANPKVR